MKTTAPERLANEIISLLKRIDEHCQGLANAKLRHGLCVVHPKQASLLPPSEELIAKMRETAQDYFTSLGATGFMFQFIGQPELTTTQGEELKLPSFDDYQLMYTLPTFDEKAEAELRARALLCCEAE